MANARLRVFADANILIRGVTFPRFPYEILRLAARRKITLVVSPSVLDDARHYLAELFPEHLSKLEAFLALANVETVAEPTKTEIEFHRDLVRDFEDVPVILAAIRARVDYFISTDTDFTDENESTEKLRGLLAPGKVMKPGLFLSQVMRWTHEQLEAISRRGWKEIQEQDPFQSKSESQTGNPST
ncbi:MAG: putative toxin-antitoxin system toxin component, PIN family [Chloroflexi bacterium]|nr:putative toxin-antitoxin system toxin component, PIN family [Chloroflexota bacterium]